MAVAIRIFANLFGVVVGCLALLFGLGMLIHAVTEAGRGAEFMIETVMGVIVFAFGGFFTVVTIRDLANFRYWFT